MRTAFNYFLVFAIATDAQTLSCFEYMKTIHESSMMDNISINNTRVSYRNIKIMIPQKIKQDRQEEI